MPKLDDLFPTNPVQVLRTGFNQTLAVIGMAIALVILAALLIWQVPELSQDYKISRNYERTFSGEILGGSCDTKMLIFVNCNVKISYLRNSEKQRDNIEFMFISFDTAADYSTNVIQAVDGPDKVTIALAVEKIWNRIALVALMAFILLAVAGAALRSFRQGRSSAKNLTKPVRLHAVVADITRSQGLIFGAMVDYSYKPEDGKRVKSSSWFNKNEALLYLSDDTALAARPEGSNIVILLDEKLLRIAFDEDERARIIQKLG